MVCDVVDKHDGGALFVMGRRWSFEGGNETALGCWGSLEKPQAEAPSGWAGMLQTHFFAQTLRSAEVGTFLCGSGICSHLIPFPPPFLPYPRPSLPLPLPPLSLPLPPSLSSHARTPARARMRRVLWIFIGVSASDVRQLNMRFTRTA